MLDLWWCEDDDAVDVIGDAVKLKHEGWLGSTRGEIGEVRKPQANELSR